MNSVSFILDASAATPDNLDILTASGRSLLDKGIQCEYLLYGEGISGLSPSPYITIIATNNSQVSLYQKAIVTACGEWLVLTPLTNVLADVNNSIAHFAANITGCHMCIPSTLQSKLQKLIGIHRLKAIPYIVVSKEFATAHITAPKEVRAGIALANRLMFLRYKVSTTSTFSSSLLENLVTVRPYISILKNKYRTKLREIKENRKQKKDLKLSLRVPRVSFDPHMPVLIICRDRVEPLMKLITWLEEEGMLNIILIDNASTYKPLLDYYGETAHEVIRLRDNIGHTSPWKSGVVQVYANDKPYIVTDPDVIPSDESHGAVKLFCELLTKYPERRKAGFGLKIDDLPNHYSLKKHVISWEKQFWVTEIERNVYDAEIDTTFAVYRQNSPYILGPGLRTGGDFVARHEPWYIDSAHPSNEILYYRKHANTAIGSWGITSEDITETYTNHALRDSGVI